MGDTSIRKKKGYIRNKCVTKEEEGERHRKMHHSLTQYRGGNVRMCDVMKKDKKNLGSGSRSTTHSLFFS